MYTTWGGWWVFLGESQGNSSELILGNFLENAELLSASTIMEIVSD